MATLPTTVRDDALALSTDLSQAGAVFDDATRLLDGGLWSTPADSNNQIAYLGMYTTDIQAVLNDINVDARQSGRRHRQRRRLALSEADTAVLQQVQGQLQTLHDGCPAFGRQQPAATTAQELLHTTQTSILAEINGDTALATALADNPFPGGTGANNVGFDALPTGSDNAAALAAATAPARRWPRSARCSMPRPISPSAASTIPNLGEFNADMSRDYDRPHQPDQQPYCPCRHRNRRRRDRFGGRPHHHSP